jgi:hypothetical protein
VGLRCDLANHERKVKIGHERVNEYLKPDPRTHTPRIRVHRDRCPTVVSQMLRHCWKDRKYGDENAQLQKERDKYDDYPSLFRYLLNTNPEFNVLRMGSPIISRRPANMEARRKQSRGQPRGLLMRREERHYAVPGR